MQKVDEKLCLLACELSTRGVWPATNPCMILAVGQSKGHHGLPSGSPGQLR